MALLRAAALAAAALALAPGARAATVAQVLAGTSDFSITAQLFAQSNMTSITRLNAPGADVTLFAPTDAAWARVGGVAFLDILGSPLNAASLQTILGHHVAMGNLTRESIVFRALMTGLGVFTWSGQMLSVRASNDTLLLDNSTVLPPEVACDNGMLYAVDFPLFPRNVSLLEEATPSASPTPSVNPSPLPASGGGGGGVLAGGGDGSANPSPSAAAPPSLPSLAQLLMQSPPVGLSTTAAMFASTNMGSYLRGGIMTLLAPTDAAWQTLPPSVNFTAAQVAEILAHHILPSEALSVAALAAAARRGESVLTLQGQTLALALTASGRVRVGGNAVIVSSTGASDVPAANGVLHRVDALLIPLSVALQYPGVLDSTWPDGGSPTPSPSPSPLATSFSLRQASGAGGAGSAPLTAVLLAGLSAAALLATAGGGRRA